MYLCKLEGKYIAARGKVTRLVELLDEALDFADESEQWLNVIKKELPVLKQNYQEMERAKTEPIKATYCSMPRGKQETKVYKNYFELIKSEPEESEEYNDGDGSNEFWYNKTINGCEKVLAQKSGKSAERSRRTSKPRRRETGQGTNATMNRISQNIRNVTKQNIGKFGKL